MVHRRARLRSVRLFPIVCIFQRKELRLLAALSLSVAEMAQPYRRRVGVFRLSRILVFRFFCRSAVIS